MRACTRLSVKSGKAYYRETSVIGRRLSHYDVLADLGAGGMGVVYRAHDTRLDRDVAIKVLPTDRPLSETARRRFQREAMAASALNHPNIITIYEVNSEDKVDFIVMEYVRGATLSSVLKKRRLELREAIRYCIQIADALTKAHAAGIIHRDLKPGNIMVTEDELIKVLDFGLAKFDPTLATADNEITDAERTNQFTLTQPGAVTGTVAYMSPEQARGDRVDARSDIFSFGIVMFEMFSGHLPFMGPNSMALLHNLHFSPPRDLTQLRADVPKPLVSLISRMLEKKTENRTQTMAEVAAELRRGATGLVDGPLTWHPSEATIDMTRPPGSAWGRFSKRSIWMAGSFLVLLLLAGIAGWRWHRKPKSAQQAGAQESPVEGNAYDLYRRAREDLDHSDRDGNVDTAIKLLDRAVELDPQSAASYAALGEAYESKNIFNPDQQWTKLASEYANKAVGLDNYLAAGHVSLGLVKMSAGDSAEAEKQFRTAADLDPKSAAPHRDLGLLYNKTGKADQSTEELKRAVQLDPNDWKTYMAMGLDSFQAGRFQEAASAWEMALKLEPDNVPVLRNLGAVYHSMGRDDDAVAALQHALEIKPDSDVYSNLGTVLFYQGRYDRAVPAFEKAVDLGANDYDNWGNLGDSYRWSSSKQDKAKPAYEHAIQLAREEIAKNPNQMMLRVNLAAYLAKVGDKDNALKELKSVDQAHDTNPSDLYTFAVVYELCGKRDQALDALLAAVKAGQDLNDIKNEPEFVSLRADPRYHLQILSAAAAKPSP
jgi:serine/threonine protein kinase/Flp pilus assembly protein TadD